MSWMQGRMSAYEEARDKGYEAGKMGEPAKPKPQIDDFRPDSSHNFPVAMGYHEHWMDGWEEGRKASQISTAMS